MPGGALSLGRHIVGMRDAAHLAEKAAEALPGGGTCGLFSVLMFIPHRPMFCRMNKFSNIDLLAKRRSA